MGEFKILSLDGGGIRGIFSSALLAKIEDDLSIRIQDYFDLIAGTSTGGIIALGLGLGMSPREILQFYIEEGHTIFGKRWYTFLTNFWRTKYDNIPLGTALRKCFGEKVFGDSNSRLIIPSYSLTRRDTYLFRTPHHEKLRRDYKVDAWKIGLATSAAPTFFPVFKGIDSSRLIDGGVWANNPSMVAITEAVGFLGASLDSIKMLSIGTVSNLSSNQKYLDRSGQLQWAASGAAVDAIMSGQSTAAHNQASILLRKGSYLRIDPISSPKEFSLDKLSNTEELMAIASECSRNNMPEISKNFCDSHVEKYQPIYGVNCDK